MGLYLPTNKKPRCCQECNWFGIKDLLDCDPKKDFFSLTIPKDCPIVEVKTPHGKLVDSEAVMDDIDAWGTTQNINHIIDCVNSETHKLT